VGTCSSQRAHGLRPDGEVHWGFPSWVVPNCSCSMTVPRRFSGWSSIYPSRASWFLVVPFFREKRYPVLTLDGFKDSVDGGKVLTPSGQDDRIRWVSRVTCYVNTLSRWCCASRCQKSGSPLLQAANHHRNTPSGFERN
jgi:hypothetical protein